MDPRGRQIRFNIPMSAHPKLHRELAWYATDDDAVPGVVVLDLAYKNSSWAVLTQSDRPQATRRPIWASRRFLPRRMRRQRCTTP
jgi:hypothetical protein